MRKLKILLAALVFVVAAAQADEGSEGKLAIQASKAKPEFTIKLKSNPTTGYSWYLRDYNSNLVQPVKHSYEPAADKALVGAGGSEVWIFKVKPAGFTVPQQTSVKLVYARPWESIESTTQKAFLVTIAN
jgi:inhibitor of cysteine peptidase